MTSAPLLFKAIAAANAVLGASLIAGGAVGFAKKRSIASLVSGLISGSTLCLSAYQALKLQIKDAFLISAVSSAVTGYVMYNRYKQSNTTTPGVIAAACFVTALLNLLPFAIQAVKSLTR